MKKLYCVALYAQKQEAHTTYTRVTNSCNAAVIAATSLNEAIGIGLSNIKLAKPIDDGWYSHDCVAIEISRDLIDSLEK